MAENKNRNIFKEYFFPIVNVPYPKLLKAATEKYPMPNGAVFEHEYNILAVFKYVYFQSILISRKFNISIKSGHDAATGVLAGLFISKLTMDAFETIQLEASQFFEEFNDMNYPQSNNYEDKKVKINWVKIKSNTKNNKQEEIVLNCNYCDIQTNCNQEDSPENCKFLASCLKEVIIDKSIPFDYKTIKDNNEYGLSVGLSDTAFKIYSDTIKFALTYFKVR